MTDTTAKTASPVARWGVVLLLMVYTALGHFNREGFAVAGNEIFIKQLGISEVRMGWVYTTFLIVYTIGMMPGGWLIDRIGSGRMLALFGLSMGMVVVLTGTLDWLTKTPLSLWIGLLVLRGLAGVCNSPLHPGAAHAASDLMHHTHRATANGLRTAGALIGIAFSYPIFGWLIDTLTWPWAFLVSGSALLVCGVVWSLFASPLLPVPQHVDSAVTIEADSLAKGLLLRDRNLWLLTLSYAAYGYFQYLFFYWMEYYFKEVLKIPSDESRRAAFYIFLAMGAGMALGGYLTDIACKLLGKTRGRRSIVMFGMGLASIFALTAVNRSDQQGITICLAISMGTLGMCEGVFWTTATDIGGKARGFSGAFMNTGGNVGGFISPVLTPYIALSETMGWTGAITVACVITGLGGLLWFVIKPPPT